MCFSSAFFPRLQLDEDIGACADTHHAADILYLGKFADFVAGTVHHIESLVGRVARRRREVHEERAHVLVWNKTRGHNFEEDAEE